jgi:DeoR family fructose operon transcriptional repressor
MFAEERHRHIGTLVRSAGRVTVTDLSERFNITQETVRRDLALLEKDGLLRRVHGGAVASTHATTRESSVASRQSQFREQKMRIARAALEMVPQTGSVVLDAGTTTGALAELLAGGTRTDLTVITHSVPIAHAVTGSSIHLELIGGRVRALTSAGVGSSAVASFSRLRADVAFIGANGIASAFGLSTPDTDEAAVKTAIVRSARRVVLLADSSKFDEESLVSFASLEEIDALVTDSTPGPALTAALADAQVEVVRA